MSRREARARRRMRAFATAQKRLQALMKKAECEAKRTGVPRPGHGEQLRELLSEIDRSDLRVWEVIRRAGMADRDRYPELHAMAAQIVAPHLAYTKPRAVRWRRELEQAQSHSPRPGV